MPISIRKALEVSPTVHKRVRSRAREHDIKLNLLASLMLQYTLDHWAGFLEELDVLLDDLEQDHHQEITDRLTTKHP